MLSSQFCQNSDNVSTTVLSKGSWDYLKRTCKSLVGPLHNTFDLRSFFLKSAGKFHFKSTTSRGKLGVDNNITSNTKSVLQITFNLVENILRCTSKNDRACVWLFAFSEESEVVIADLFNFKDSTVGSNI
jgi:hypothetical protein